MNARASNRPRANLANVGRAMSPRCEAIGHAPGPSRRPRRAAANPAAAVQGAPRQRQGRGCCRRDRRARLACGNAALAGHGRARAPMAGLRSGAPTRKRAGLVSSAAPPRQPTPATIGRAPPSRQARPPMSAASDVPPTRRQTLRPLLLLRERASSRANWRRSALEHSASCVPHLRAGVRAQALDGQPPPSVVPTPTKVMSLLIL